MKILKLIGIILVVVSIVLMLSLTLFTSSVSAIQFDNLSGTTSGTVSKGNGYFSDDANIFNYTEAKNVYTITEPSRIYILEPIGYALGTASAQSPIAKGDSNLIFGTVASSGYLYFVDASGIKKKLSRDSSVPVFANDTGIGGGCAIISSDVPTSLYEYNSNLYYVVSGQLKYISLSDEQVNVASEYTSMHNFGLSAGTVNGELTVYTTDGFYEGGIIYARVYKSNATNKNVLISSYSDAAANYAANQGATYGTTFITENYLYVNINTFVYSGSIGSTYARLERVLRLSNNSIYSNFSYVGSGVTNHSMGFLGENSNVMLAANATSKKYGTYNFLESGTAVEYTAPASLVYDTAIVYSTYGTYYNNSLFDINYQLTFNTDQYDWNLNLVQINTLKYSHRVDLINPDGIRVGTYPITSATCDTFWMNSAIYMLLNPDAIFPCTGSGNFNFQALTAWVNGTYTVKLYEVTIASGVISLLSSDSFDVLDEKGTLAGTNSVTENQNNLGTPAGLDNVLGSGWFIPVLIILMLGITGAKSAGHPGFVGGYTLGYIIVFVAGMIPTWALFMFVITTILMAGFMVGKNIVSSGG